MPAYSNTFYDLVYEARDTVEAAIKEDPECLDCISAEEDLEKNRDRYYAIILAWQLQMLKEEVRWDTSADDAGVKVAAMAEFHNMFFGQMGVSSMLENIKFQLTEEDQQQIQEILLAKQEEFSE